MEVVAEIKTFQCPECGAIIEPAPNAGIEVECPLCKWSGEVRLFKPIVPPICEAQPATGNDAVCAHHPTKRAVAICEGTGSYICPLCLVELDGKKYSVQFLEGKGRQTLDQFWYRYLDRPDGEMSIYFGMGFFLSIMYVLSPVALFLFAPLGIFKFIKLVKARKTNPVLRDLVPTPRLIAYGLAILLVSFFFASISIALFYNVILRGWD